MAEDKTPEQKQEEALRKALKADNNGDAKVTATFRGAGKIHTGDGGTAEQGQELTIPYETAIKLCMSGYADPVAIKAKKDG